MIKKLPLLPMTIIALFFVLACSREQSLTDGSFSRLSMARDSIDTTDTIPTPVDTIPDSVWTTIKGLEVRPSSIRNDSVLRLDLKTTNRYPTNSAYLIMNGRIDSSTVYVNVQGIWHSGPAADSTPALGAIQGRGLAPGNYPLKIKLKTQTYTGSVSVTSTQYNFNWAHDSIILIHPKTVQRVP